MQFPDFLHREIPFFVCVSNFDSIILKISYLSVS